MEQRKMEQRLTNIEKSIEEIKELKVLTKIPVAIDENLRLANDATNPEHIKTITDGDNNLKVGFIGILGPNAAKVSTANRSDIKRYLLLTILSQGFFCFVSSNGFSIVILNIYSPDGSDIPCFLARI